MTSIIHGAVLDPTEDSTADNLRALADLIDQTAERRMDRTLTCEDGALKLTASGTRNDCAVVAVRAAREAIFPTVEAHCDLCRRDLESTLANSPGITVTVAQR